MSFMEIFQPGLKFLREERERQRLDVAYPTDGADPLMKIDLDAGTATIVIPTPQDQSSEESESMSEAATDEAATDEGATDEAATDEGDELPDR